MTRSELVMGLSIFLVVAVAGFVSITYVDRYFAAADACVGEDGSWKNWPWANAPTLVDLIKRTICADVTDWIYS